MCLFFFFFNNRPTTEISTLSQHAALPISEAVPVLRLGEERLHPDPPLAQRLPVRRRLVIRARRLEVVLVEVARDLPPARSEEHTSELQSANISYAVFCLKKKKDNTYITQS